jgi:hypothetical protein
VITQRELNDPERKRTVFEKKKKKKKKKRKIICSNNLIKKSFTLLYGNLLKRPFNGVYEYEHLRDHSFSLVQNATVPKVLVGQVSFSFFLLFVCYKNSIYV